MGSDIPTGPVIGDPRAPEVVGQPGAHEPRFRRRDAPLSRRGRLVWWSVWLVIVALVAAIVLATR